MTKRILVAEDDPALSRAIELALSRAGFEVVIADNGRAAIEQLSAAHFDLLITDCNMPLANGTDVCQAARHDLNLVDLPIAFCTGKGAALNSQDLVQRFQVAHIFSKPFSLRDVVAFAKQVTESAIATPVA